MEKTIDIWFYLALGILVMVSVGAVASSANKELKRPVVVYGCLGLSWLFPIALPIYLGFMFFKAKSTRLFIYFFLLLVCLLFLSFSFSKFSKNIEFHDLYSRDVALKAGDGISIEGGFVKLHESQYIVPKEFNIGRTRYISNDFYYEIVPVSDDAYRKVRVFVADSKIYDSDNLPSENLVSHEQFDAYVYYLKNVDIGALGKIRATLDSGQELLFIAKQTQSRYESNQKIAKIGSSVMGLLALIFSILAFREFKVRRNQSASV